MYPVEYNMGYSYTTLQFISYMNLFSFLEDVLVQI